MESMDLRKELYLVLFPNQLDPAEEGDLTALPCHKLVTLPSKPRDDVGPWEFAMSQAGTQDLNGKFRVGFRLVKFGENAWDK